MAQKLTAIEKLRRKLLITQGVVFAAILLAAVDTVIPLWNVMAWILMLLAFIGIVLVLADIIKR